MVLGFRTKDISKQNMYICYYMSEIKYTTLNDLININPNLIEMIKDQYLVLLSDLTSTTYIETELFMDNIEKISEMGKIIVGIVNDENKNTFFIFFIYK